MDRGYHISIQEKMKYTDFKKAVNALATMRIEEGEISDRLYKIYLKVNMVVVDFINLLSEEDQHDVLAVLYAKHKNIL